MTTPDPADSRTMALLRDALVEIVGGPRLAKLGEIGPRTRLFAVENGDTGLDLDSLDVLELISTLEMRTGILLDPDAVDFGAFTELRDIADAMEKLAPE